jgi:sulfoxide reductase heme-binding subunit YedZ
LGVLTWRFVTGTLGVDEVNAVYYYTGRAALILLALSLAATPISFIFGYSKALTVRRPLGLYGFLFAALHFTGFLTLDYGLDLNIILMDAILTKPYIVVGLLALLILLALAITSTQGWQRRLRRNWTRLHRLVYVAVLLAALHFFWQAKTPERWEPLIYGVIFTLLLIVRIPPVRQWFVQLRQRQSAEKSPAPRPAPLRSRQTE